MNKICLSDICEVSAGQAAPQKKEFFNDDGYPFVRAGSLESLIAGNDKLEHIKANIGDKLRLRLFPKNTILFAKSGMYAKIGRVYKLLQPSYVVSHLAAIIPNEEKVNPDFLKRWFEFHPPSRLIPNEAYPSIKLSDILRLSLTVVSLEEQNRISMLINTADTLRQKRKKQLNLLDDYLKSVFFEMFGDLVINDKGWCTNKLSEISEVVSGVTKGRKLNPENCVTVPYMRVANVQDGHINISDLKEISVLPSDVEKYRLQRGDVLLTEGGDPDKLGRGAVWCYDITNCIHQNHIFRVRISSTNIIQPLFLSWLIRSAYGKRYFLRAAKQTTGIATINSTQLKKFPVQIPPIDLQNKFASIVEQIEQTKQKMRASLDEMDNHFNALMQRYFG